MRVLALRIGGFGRLSSLDVEFGDGLTVVVGPNEAGKTTIVECIVRMLFGFPKTRFAEDLKRYEPWRAGVPYSASLRYALEDGRAFEVSRDFGRADVPTQTVEVGTRRPVSDLCGNRTASPGESIFGFSLDVYRAAAVVRAEDLSNDLDQSTAHQLADRLAAAVGSGGDASAAEAIERLKHFHAEIGVRSPNTPMGVAAAEAQRADEALRAYRSDYEDFDATVARGATLDESLQEETARRGRCKAAWAAAKLRETRAKITAAQVSRDALAAAVAARTALPANGALTAGQRRDVEAAIEALRAADQREADAAERATARDDERVTRQREIDNANAALAEKRASVHRLAEKIASNEELAGGRAAIGADDLAAIERLEETADAAEARQRALETEAAIARQTARPAPAGALAASVVAVALGAVWLFSHLAALGVAAAVLAVLAVVLFVRLASSTGARSSAIAAKESAAAAAAQAAKPLADALSAACRKLGCTTPGAVRAARSAQADRESLLAQKRSAEESAALLEAQRDAVQSRYKDLIALESDRVTAHANAVRARDALAVLFDAAAVPAGSMEERLAQYRASLDAGARAAASDVAVADARSALAQALGGATFESLEDEASEYAIEASAGGDPGEFGHDDVDDLDRELGRLDARLGDLKMQLHGAHERVEEFQRQHPKPLAELEERAAAARDALAHLETAKTAAKIAWEAIEQVKDAVHSDFTPPLNEAVGRSIDAITGGRYTAVWVDQADFALRTRAAETGADVDGDRLSAGTVEQLQFALRAAVAKTLGKGERVPLLYDDALAHADDDRLEAAIRLAASLAHDGSQIVFFTQRREVEQLVRETAGARVIRLPGPGG